MRRARRASRAHRGISATALAVVVAVGLSGCIYSDFVGGSVNAAGAATRLADELRAIDGVADADARFDLFDGPAGAVSVDVGLRRDAPPAAWRAVAQTVLDASTGDDLSEVALPLRMDAGGAVLSADGRTADPLAIERSAVSMQDVASALAVPVDVELGGGGAQLTYRFASVQDVVRAASAWGLLRQPDPVASDDGERWEAPGLVVAGRPTTAILETYAALAATTDMAALEDADPPPAALWLESSVRGVRVQVMTADVEQTESTPEVVDAVRAALSAPGIDAISWWGFEQNPDAWVEVLDDGTAIEHGDPGGAALHRGACAGHVEVRPSHERFAASLAVAGLDLGDYAPGACVPA